MSNQMICGDALLVLRTLPSNHVHMVCTSPPYYGLRDYGVDGQIGLEESPEEYIEKLTDIFIEVKRVLRQDGVLFLNLGDSYAGSRKGSGNRDHGKLGKHAHDFLPHPTDKTSLPPRNLYGIPWRVAFALQASGYILRADIIWEKPNSLPESVKNRPTNSHEYVFMLTKSPYYFYDAEAIKEPTSDMTRMLSASNRTAHSRQGNGEEGKSVRFGSTPNGRNKRSVWSIPTTPFKESHFAVMAPELARICILAGSAEKTCEHCGAAWERITETEYIQGKTSGEGNKAVLEDVSSTSIFLTGREPRTRTTGFQPTCTCFGNTGSGKSIVLDPFSGAGTTAFVSAKLGRAYLGIELNPAYVEMSSRRLAGLADGFWGFAEEIA